MKQLDAQSTAALLPWDALVDALAQVMRERRQGRIHAPPRAVMPLPEGGVYLAMSATDAALALSKLVAVTPANRARGLPTLHGTVVVSDARHGQTLCTLDGPTLTARRTAALSLLGIETLLRRRPQRVVLLGTGVQARAHAEATWSRWSPERLCVVGRRLASAQAFAAELQEAGIEALARDLPGALADAEVVVCLTTARAPVLPEGLRRELLLVGVGAFTPAMAEIPPQTARTRQVVVDDLHGAREEAGDLLQARVEWSRVTELADALDRVPASSAGYVLKTVGHSAWDLAAARVAVAHPDFALAASHCAH